MQDILTSFQTYGYIALFIYSLGGGFFGIIAATTLSAIGKMDLIISFIVATTSNYTGDMLLFYLARYNKNLISNQISKNRRYFALSNLLIKKYGDFSVFLQKFIYGVKTLIPIAMGLSKYSFLKFGILNIFASVIFVGIVTYLSFVASDSIINLALYLKSHPYIYPVVIFGIFGLIYLYFKKAVRK